LVSDKRRSTVLTTSRLLHTFTAKVTQLKPHSARYDVRKAMKYNFLSVLQGMQGRGETSIQVSILNIIFMQ